MARGGGQCGKKTGREVGVKSCWLLLEGNLGSGEGERGAVAGEQTALVGPGYPEVAGVTLESVTISLSVASSTKGPVQPQSSTILGTCELLGTESHWAHQLVLDSRGEHRVRP